MSRTDVTIIALIEEMALQGKNTYEIINIIQRRNTELGKHDMRDRSLFPTPGEIRRIVYSFQMSNRCHATDSISVGMTLKTDLKDDVIFTSPCQEVQDNLCR